jgi:predicted ribosomally synthesized peptide with SipW-like signal peptide
MFVWVRPKRSEKIMSKTKTKRYLVLLSAIGLIVAGLGGSGTFASFSAEVTNSGNTFQTGTLLLSDSVNSAAACFSDTDASNSEKASCQAVINTLPVSTNTTKSGRLEIKNTGSLDSNDLKLYGSSCGQSTVGTFPGGALTHASDFCSQLLISVEEHSSNNSLVGSAIGCPVGTLSGSVCIPTGGVPLTTFLTAYPSGTPFAFSGILAAGASRYFTVYLHLPDLENTYQGLAASFDLTWHIDQA